MKKLILIALLAASTLATAQTWVDGYTRRDGSYVSGHWKNEANEYRYDNRNSQSNGGRQRDEYSDTPTYNRTNPLSPEYGQPKRKCTKDIFGYVSCD